MMRIQGVVIGLVLYLKASFSHLDVCGRAPFNSRMTSGYHSAEGAWPWQVILQPAGRYEKHFCGGSLINKDWVLTAASCFDRRRNDFFIVYLGKHTQNGYSPNQISRRVKQVILHDKYNSTNRNNDIALVRLHASVTFSNFIRPVCLAGLHSSVVDGTINWVTGWESIKSTVSSAGQLQEAIVPAVHPFICDFLLNPGSITRNMMCAGYLEGGPDTCKGDIGGPLVVKYGAAWIQTGITSWGSNCTQRSKLRVYTKVSSYQVWISSIIRRNLPGFVDYNAI